MPAMRSASDGRSLFAAHIEARLACAAPGDVLVICTRDRGCGQAARCPSCLHVRVSPGTSSIDLLAQLDRLGR
jgi:hypothetical protein